MNKKRLTYDTIIIGGGQAGLVTGYYLKQQGHDFVILDANKRVGDSWRKRWDSLELFTAAKYNALPGLPFNAVDSHYPSKDEMADYLEAYAKKFALPIRLSTRVQNLSRENKTYTVRTENEILMAHNVIVATGAYSKPNIPAWADELDESIHQISSKQYRNPQQLEDGKVLVVGAASSGVQIALDIKENNREVWLAGKYSGYVPRFLLGIDVFGVLIRTIFYFSVDTWIGKRIRKIMKSKGNPVVDIPESEVIDAGIVRTGRVVGVRDGMPLLEDGSVIDADVIIWATGFKQHFGWIDLPIFDQKGMPRHYRGVVEEEIGIYFIGLSFLYRGKSPLLCGVSDDAAYTVNQLTTRSSMRERDDTPRTFVTRST